MRRTQGSEHLGCRLWRSLHASLPYMPHAEAHCASCCGIAAGDGMQGDQGASEVASTPICPPSHTRGTAPEPSFK